MPLLAAEFDRRLKILKLLGTPSTCYEPRCWASVSATGASAHAFCINAASWSCDLRDGLDVLDPLSEHQATR